MLGIKTKWKMKVPLHQRKLKQSSANIIHKAWVKMPWFWGFFSCVFSFSQLHYHLYVWSYCMMLNWITQNNILFIMGHNALWCISITVLVDFARLQPWGVCLVLTLRLATKFTIKWEIMHGKLMTLFNIGIRTRCSSKSLQSGYSLALVITLTIKYILDVVMNWF
jgi:hypothetical protein